VPVMLVIILDVYWGDAAEASAWGSTGHSPLLGIGGSRRCALVLFRAGGPFQSDPFLEDSLSTCTP